MDNIQAAARRYIDRVLNELGVTPGALARMSGVAPSTLTRFLNSADHKFVLSSTTLEKIYRATSIAPLELADIEGGRVRSDFPHRSEKERGTYIHGEVRPGVWHDPRRYDPEEIFPSPLSVALSKWDFNECFAVFVTGESVGQFAKVGDYMLCVNFKAYVEKYPITDGVIVVVERTSSDRKLLETTARKLVYRKVDGGSRLDAADLYLFDRSGDGLDETDVIEDVSFEPSGSNGVRLLGVVTAAVSLAVRGVVR